MRVLYLTEYPNALSESYIRSEIEWMQGHGVEIEILARQKHDVVAPCSVPFTVGQPLARAVERFQPDVLQAEWLFMASAFKKEYVKLSVPVTARGHGFDFTHKRVAELASTTNVRRIWLFPHFAAQTAEPKVSPLTCAYRPDIYQPGEQQRPRFVFRMTAGVPHKSLAGFLDVARLCPEVPFMLVATRVMPPLQGYVDEIKAQAPRNVDVRLNVQRDEIAALTRAASIYLYTKPSHPIGMPVGISEAMGSGLVPVVYGDTGVADYIGDAGRTYHEPAEAAAIIRGLLAQPESAWADARARAIARAEQYQIDRVFPAVLAEWQRIVGGPAA